MNGRRFMLVFLVALISSGATLWATTIVRMSLERLSQAAKVIIRGHCITTFARWDSGEIWTFASFTVDEVWHGSATPRVVVRLLGGSAGNITSTVSGVPHFHVGDDVVLFLEPTARGDLTVVGWQQGTFRIRRNNLTGRVSVTQDSGSFETFDPVIGTFGTAGLRNMPLDLFRTRVAAALQENAGGRQ
jgi:hypothetical protein